MSLSLRGTLASTCNTTEGNRNTYHDNGTRTSNNHNYDHDDHMFWIQVENNEKRTSFLYDDNDTSTCTSSTDSTAADSASGRTNMAVVKKPCHLLIDCCVNTTAHSKHGHHANTHHNINASTSSLTFLFGGLEIHSNSRNIEAYALTEQEEQQSTGSTGGKLRVEYLQTYRGTLLTNNTDNNNENSGGTNKDHTCLYKQELYKTIIIPPNSKPIPIVKLQLKLLSLRPAKCNEGYVRLIKVKGKLPDVDINAIVDKSTGNSAFSANDTAHSSNTSTEVAANLAATATATSTLSSSQQLQQQHRPSQTTSNIPSITLPSTSQISNAISAITILIQNTQQQMEKSISTTYGELQTFTFQQNQHLQSSLESLQQSIQDVNDNLNLIKQDLNLIKSEQEELKRCFYDKKTTIATGTATRMMTTTTTTGSDSNDNCSEVIEIKDDDDNYTFNDNNSYKNDLEIREESANTTIEIENNINQEGHIDISELDLQQQKAIS